MIIKENQVQAVNRGLKDGVLSKALDFRNYHNNFILKRERDAYKYSHGIVQINNYVEIYKKGKHK